MDAPPNEQNADTAPPHTLADMLGRVWALAVGNDQVTLAAILAVIGRRAYGPLLLVIGLISISPLTAAPGATWLAATVTLALSLQWRWRALSVAAEGRARRAHAKQRLAARRGRCNALGAADRCSAPAASYLACRSALCVCNRARMRGRGAYHPSPRAHPAGAARAWAYYFAVWSIAHDARRARRQPGRASASSAGWVSQLYDWQGAQMRRRRAHRRRSS